MLNVKSLNIFCSFEACIDIMFREVQENSYRWVSKEGGGKIVKGLTYYEKEYIIVLGATDNTCDFVLLFTTGTFDVY